MYGQKYWATGRDGLSVTRIHDVYNARLDAFGMGELNEQHV